MKNSALLLLVGLLLGGCTTIDLSRTAQDDLYWTPSDEPVYATQYEEVVPGSSHDDYWDGSETTTATTESGDVIVNNYYGNTNPGWSGWDPYWGWGFGVGWYGPRHYRRWYSMSYWNSWYSPMWYHDPWFWDPFWGHTYHPHFGVWGNPWGNPWANPWGNPWVYNQWGPGWMPPGGTIIDGSGSGSGGGIYVGSFNPISTNSSGNSSYNNDGQHEGRTPRRDYSLTEVGSQEVIRPEASSAKPDNYVEVKPLFTDRPSVTTSQGSPVRESAASNSSQVSRGLLNIPQTSTRQNTQPSAPSGSIKVPTPQAAPSNPGPSQNKKPGRQQNWNVPSGNPLPPSPPSHSSPSRSSGSGSFGSPSRSSGGGGGGGGRPPRN